MDLQQEMVFTKQQVDSLMNQVLPVTFEIFKQSGIINKNQELNNLNHMKIDNGQLSAFLQGITPISFEIFRMFGITETKVTPVRGSPLFLVDKNGKQMPLYLNFDRVIGLSTLCMKSWEYTKIKNYLRLSKELNFKKVALIDVGANIGLFSRQLKVAFGEMLVNIVSFEPHPDNFRLLEKNLSGIAHCKNYQTALGELDTTMDLYTDAQNSGNYSFNNTAILPEYSFGSVAVSMSNANKTIESVMNEIDLPYVYKSDTQGFDETIACSLPREFWAKTKLATFELWALPEKNYDMDKFANILSGFKYLTFEKNFGVMVTPKDVLDYVTSGSQEQDDLYVWN